MSDHERLAGRIQNLEKRARLNRAIRAFFDERGFIEIDAPIWVPSPGLEIHLDAFEVKGGGYLITSPEYQMKRLLAGGMAKIYSLGKVFRRGEVGREHNPEFTMLEWYRAGAGWEEIARETEALLTACAHATAAHDPGPFRWKSVRELFAEHAGLALDGDESLEVLRQKIAAAGHRPIGEHWDDLFFQVWLDTIEPHLAGTLVYDWPAPLCALARKKPSDPRVVERFEIYARGKQGVIELCNAFGELTDPAEQRERCARDLAERRRRGLPEYPIDDRFLAALAEMPPSAGIALGVDRLAMLFCEAEHIREVLPFSADEL